MLEQWWNVAYRCVLYNINKSEAIHLLKNSVLGYKKVLS